MILLIGSSQFSAIIFHNIIQKHNVGHILTTKPNPNNRGKTKKNVVQEYCEKNNIKFTYEIDIINDYDKIVLASYGRYIPSKYITKERLFLNVHPSLLPKYRGASPMQYAIMNGDKIAGCSIIDLHPEIDAGDLWAQQEYNIDGKYFEQAEKELAEIGSKQILHILDNYQTIKKAPQKTDGITLTNKISKEERIIDYRHDVYDIHNRIRAFPCRCVINDIELIIYASSYIYEKHEHEFGYVALDKHSYITNCRNMSIACKNGWLIPTSIQPINKSILNIKDFLNGYARRVLPN